MFMRNIKSAVFFLCYVLGFVVRVIAAYWKSWMEFRWSFVVWKRLFRIGANVFKHLIEFPSKVCLAAVCRLLGERPNLVGGHILCVFKCSFERRPLNHGALLPPSGQILATSQFWLRPSLLAILRLKVLSLLSLGGSVDQCPLEKTPLRMGQHSWGKTAWGQPADRLEWVSVSAMCRHSAMSGVCSKGGLKIPHLSSSIYFFPDKESSCPELAGHTLQVNLVCLILFEEESTLRKLVDFMHGGSWLCYLLFSFLSTLPWGLVLDSAWGQRLRFI